MAVPQTLPSSWESVSVGGAGYSVHAPWEMLRHHKSLRQSHHHQPIKFVAIVILSKQTGSQVILITHSFIQGSYVRGRGLPGMTLQS